MSRRQYRVVDQFEYELANYAGSNFAVAVNSCTNALLLALSWEKHMKGSSDGDTLFIPKRTYIGVLQSALNAGWKVEFEDREWQDTGVYELHPSPVFDSARYLAKGMHVFPRRHVCLSFHSAKQLPLGRGGAILTNDRSAAAWFRAARMDGRPPGQTASPVFPGWHCPMPPDVAARGVDVLSRWNDADYSPPPLTYTDYPDLSQWWSN